ncbi:MAG: acyltransferase [Nibricoccus sp.]
MTRATSAFLDLLRLAAAFTVFLAHTAHYWNPSLVDSMQVVAHDAVILFFVLSGYVIACTTKEKCQSARDYAVARLSRLYSVVVPALLLTAVLWPLGSQLDPGLYAHYARSGGAVRYLLTFLHLNEIWFFDAYPPSNTPFWSLGYEASYYVLFGLFWFVKRSLWRWLLLTACAFAIGPKVLLLLPAWLAGVFAQLFSDRWRMNRVTAIALFFVFGAWLIAAIRWMRDWPYPMGVEPWYFSNAAGTDLIKSVGWAGLIWAFSRGFGGAVVPGRMHRVVRWSANHTFSLYLYHAPLVIFATALVPPIGRDLTVGISVVGAILLVIIGLAALTEGQRRHWQTLFAWIFRKATWQRSGSPAKA